MATTFEIGTIPAISVWEGQTMTFSVRHRRGHANFLKNMRRVSRTKFLNS